jgi:hypothetical protein
MNPTTSADLSAATWRKSTRSSGGGSNCIEVAHLPGFIAIRDSKNTEGGKLIVSHAAFQELSHRIGHGTLSAGPGISRTANPT